MFYTTTIVENFIYKPLLQNYKCIKYKMTESNVNKSLIIGVILALIIFYILVQLESVIKWLIILVVVIVIALIICSHNPKIRQLLRLR